jgi:RNA polymerase sigma factor (sigma-70 family)
VDDRDIVAAMRGEDAAAGLASAYDAYAGKLHAYCWTLLHDHDAASDAVQDTFIVAGRCIDQLRDPDRLRPWLYSIARNESLRQLRSAARSAPLDEAGDVMDESAPEAEQGLRQDETRDLVWSAAKGLNPGEYEVLELHLRHELEGADLASALGVTRNHAHALLSRARAQFEVSLSALLVARTGREACPELDALLADWDGSITVLLRKRINRHIEQCDICGERKRRELQPALLLSALPFVLAPATLRDRLFKLVSDPRMEGYRRMVAERAAPFGPDGFVKPLDGGAGTGGKSGNNQGGNGPDDGGGGGSGGDGNAEGADADDAIKKHKQARKAALAALLALLLIGAVALVTVKTVFASPTAAGSSTPTSSAESVVSSLAAPQILFTSASPSASPSVSPSPSPSASASPSPSPNRVVTPTTKPAAPPPSSPALPPISLSPSPPPIPTLVVTPGSVTMSDDPSPGVGSFTVTMSNGSAVGTVTVESDLTRYLGWTITPNSADTSVTVDVAAKVDEGPEGGLDLTVNSSDATTNGPVTVLVSWPPPPIIQ